MKHKGVWMHVQARYSPTLYTSLWRGECEAQRCRDATAGMTQPPITLVVNVQTMGTLGFSKTMGLPLPMAPLASSTLQVLAMASTKTDGSLAMTGEMVLRNCLTGMAAEEPPAQSGDCQPATIGQHLRPRSLSWALPDKYLLQLRRDLFSSSTAHTSTA